MGGKREVGGGANFEKEYAANSEFLLAANGTRHNYDNNSCFSIRLLSSCCVIADTTYVSTVEKIT